MPDVSLSVSTLAEVNLFILTAAITVGLATARPVSRPTRWLAAAIAALAVSIVANLFLSPRSVLSGGPGIGRALGFVVSSAMVALHSVALVGFAYSHAGDVGRREARSVLVGLFWLFSVCALASALGTWTSRVRPDREAWEWVELIPSIALFLLPVPVCLWAAVVEIRNGSRLVRAARKSGGRIAAAWQAFVSPLGREGRAHRAFALFMALGAFMVLYRSGAADPTAPALDLDPWHVAAIAYVVVLAALFLSYAPDPVPLRTRLTVLVLGAALALLTAVPYLAVNEVDILTGDGIVPPRETVHFAPMPGGGVPYRAVGRRPVVRTRRHRRPLTVAG